MAGVGASGAADRQVTDAHMIALRAATAADVPMLAALIERSAATLSRGFYSDAETRAAIAHVFGVDSQLIADGTYLVAEDAVGRPVGCGGWSRRATLFGGDGYEDRSPAPLDPAADAARIRAFFVDPAAARAGVGSALLDACEAAARTAGFTRLALMATLPGVPFYARHGFVADAASVFDLDGTPVAFVPMAKPL